MLSYKQIIKRLRDSEDSNVKELYSKLSDEDFEHIMINSQNGIFTQIKKNLINVTTLETDIPKVGRLVTSASKLKRKLTSLFLQLDSANKELLKPLLLISEKKDINTYRANLQTEIEKFISLLILKYEQYDYDNQLTRKGNTIEKITMGTSIYIDIVKREQVEKLLSDSKLTLDKFILEMKRINVPVTKAWFLVSYQIINDLVIKKKEAKMSKIDFKTKLEQGGLYVENIGK